MQKSFYLLENFEVISSPWNNLEAGDAYQKSKIKTKLSEYQYSKYLDFHNFLINRYNRISQKVDKNTIGLILAGTYSEACGLLNESMAAIKSDLINFINNQIL